MNEKRRRGKGGRGEGTRERWGNKWTLNSLETIRRSKHFEYMYNSYCTCTTVTVHNIHVQCCSFSNL